MDYNLQYIKLERIIIKHWGILLKDRTLGPVLAARPQFIYRRAPTLRDVIAPDVVDPLIVKESRFFSFLSGFDVTITGIKNFPPRLQTKIIK